MSKEKVIYPFSAIVGQESMKKALILNVINPSLGGVLIRGEKGTAKSTAVRALAELLLEMNQVEGCMFGCDSEDMTRMCSSCMERLEKGETLNSVKRKMRVVELPVSATEDRVVGTLDIEHAIKKGEKCFEPGILAQSNRNILYVDEVNLLDDHVVDILLDSAAMGVNTIEREGISFSHPARFVLVGTMNPEEGDLRPQLLDRFGLVVDVVGEKDVENRMEVIKRRLEYEMDPEAYTQKYEAEQQKLQQKIAEAQQKLVMVSYDDEILKMTAEISMKMGVDGHRADITLLKTAMTIAAFDVRDKVNKQDILEAAYLVLPHRMRKRPFEDGTLEFSRIEEIVNESA